MDSYHTNSYFELRLSVKCWSNINDTKSDILLAYILTSLGGLLIFQNIEIHGSSEF